MTTCLLCTAPAVADSLCITDGARLWAAQKRSNGKPCGVLVALLRGTNDPREGALNEIADSRKAAEFTARLAAAREERRKQDEAKAEWDRRVERDYVHELGRCEVKDTRNKDEKRRAVEEMTRWLDSNEMRPFMRVIEQYHHRKRLLPIECWENEGGR